MVGRLWKRFLFILYGSTQWENKKKCFWPHLNLGAILGGAGRPTLQLSNNYITAQTWWQMTVDTYSIFYVFWRKKCLLIFLQLLGQKPNFGLYLGLKRVLFVFTLSQIGVNPNPTINGAILNTNMCLLGPKKLFWGPKTEKIWFLGRKRCAPVPFLNTKG